MMLRAAVFSEDRTYRFTLSRTWDPLLPSVSWIMLNPSTADDEKDDPTIRRCIGFAQRWGCGGIDVVNLFAYRATNPRELMAAAEPTGGQANLSALRWAASKFCVVAWGATKTPPKPNLNLDPGLWCLGVTRSGEPRHPLYVAYDTPLELWPGVL